METKNKIASIENWSIIDSPYPGEDGKIVFGNVYNHPAHVPGTESLKDGHRILTSLIVSLDLDNKMVLTKSGTKYKLGEAKNAER